MRRQAIGPMQAMTDTDAAGFTLIELMIAIVLSSLIISGIYEVLSGQQMTYAVQDRLNEQRQDLRAAMLIMRAEMEKLAYDPSCVQTPPACDIPGEDYINDTSNGGFFEFKFHDGIDIRTVKYAKSGDHLMRTLTVGAGLPTSATLVKNVQSLAFTYYDKDGIVIIPTTQAEWHELCRVDLEILDRFTAFPGRNEEQVFTDRMTASVNVRNPLSDARNPASLTFDGLLVCDQ